MLVDDTMQRCAKPVKMAAEKHDERTRSFVFIKCLLTSGFLTTEELVIHAQVRF